MQAQQLSSSNQSVFSLGSTSVASEALRRIGWGRIVALLQRHASGDWGDVTPLRARANALAVDQGYPILSQYMLREGFVTVLTEDDRTRTFVLAAPPM